MSRVRFFFLVRNNVPIRGVHPARLRAMRSQIELNPITHDELYLTLAMELQIS